MSFVELEAESPACGSISKENVVAEPGGGRSAAPASRGGVFTRLCERYRQSVWAPVALKATTILLFMSGLAGVGAASILSGVEGVRVPARAPVADDIGSAWLATRRAPVPRRPAAHHAAAPAPSTRASTDRTDAGSRKKRPGITPDGKVILNIATAAELTRLPGIGVKRAQSIVKLRARLKRFHRVTDLLRVRGIGVRSLKRMLPHLVLNPPAAADGGPRS